MGPEDVSVAVMEASTAQRSWASLTCKVNSLAIPKDYFSDFSAGTGC